MKFSIIIPAWKADATIEKCLDSIFEQDHFINKSFEVILMIDGCKKTLEKVMQIKNKYQPELEIYYQEKNLGTYIALNTAISKAKNDIIAVFGADDEMYPNMISSIDHRYDSNSNIDFVRFKYDNYKNGELIGQVKYFSHGAISFKRSVWSELNGFIDWRVAGDTHFCIRAGKVFNESLLNESLFRRNIHPKSMTQCTEYGQGSDYRIKCVNEINKISITRDYKLDDCVVAKCSEIKKDPPLITVGMPIYKMADVAFHAFEGLEQQDFNKPWELIITQELNGRYDWSKHKNNLRRAGCIMAVEKVYDHPVTIGEKAYFLSLKAKGRAVMIQDGDDKSHRKRLSNIYKSIVVGKKDFYNEKFGVFVNLKTSQRLLFVHDKKIHPTGLNKAYSTSLFKKLDNSIIKISKHLDRNLFQILKPKKIEYNTEKNYDGYFTDGYNKISKRDKYYDKPEPPFYSLDPERKQGIKAKKIGINIDSFVINKHDEKARYQIFREEEEKSGLNSQLFRSVPITDERITEQINDLRRRDLPYDRDKKSAEISNRLSFSDILMIREDKDVLIFEDDCKFHDESDIILKNIIDQLPKDFGVCFLGCYIRDKIELDQYSENLAEIRTKDPKIWGANAVIYSKKIRYKLGEILQSRSSKITDFQIVQSIIPDHRCFIANPMICFQNTRSQIYTKSKMHGEFDLEHLEMQSLKYFVDGLN